MGEPTDLEIRPARPADHETIERIMEAALIDAGAYLEDVPEDGQPGFDPSYYDHPRSAFVVAESAGAVVGTGGYRPPAGLITEVGTGSDEKTAELKRMHVRPEHQRNGVATAILSTLRARASDTGYETFVLLTTSMQQAAIAFYESHGFERYLCESVTADGRSFDLLGYRGPTAV